MNLEGIKILRRIAKANFSRPSSLVGDEIELICNEQNIDISLLLMSEERFNKLIDNDLLRYYINY